MEKKLKEKLEDGTFKNVSTTRSQTMGNIRGKGNKTTEVRFRFSLVRAGIKGWKLHPKEILGCPDFYFPTQRVAVFIDGCFWHGCPKCGHIPKTRTEFWKEKIRRNRERDKHTSRKLKKDEIIVLRFWEHELKKNLHECIAKLRSVIETR